MLKRIDRSRLLLNLLQRLSNLLARQRGLPVVIGVVLVVLSLAVQSINVFTENNLLELLGVILLHGGVLTALIGLMLANPLGK